MTERNVVILGGGIGGIVAARTLRKRLPADVRVTLVDRDASHTFSPSLLWLLTGERTSPQITRGRERLARAGVELVTGPAEGLDPDARTLRVDGRDIAFDRLVVALGAQAVPDLMPGLARGGIDIYSPEGATAAGRALRELDGGRVAIVIAKPPYKCPAAPNEAAFLAEALLRRVGTRAQVALYTPEPYPMPTAGEALGTALAGMLRARGIELHTGHVLEEVDPDAKTLVFQGGDRAAYDLLLAIPPHRTSDIVRSSGLANEGGFIPVDRATLATSAPSISAIGDVTQIPIAGGKFLPKAGVFAKAQAAVVASRIADEMAGHDPRATFDGTGSCFVDMGEGVAAFATGDFYAEPAPAVRLRRPGRRWKLAKVAFEKYWLARWA
jgi:sulfide:quinone oxidoreductase